jgi:hypothetical protein
MGKLERDIILLSGTSKLHTDMLLNKRNKYAEDYVEEQDCGFRKGTGCTDVAFILQQMTGKQWKQNLSTYVILADCEKAYDSLNQDIIW